MLLYYIRHGDPIYNPDGLTEKGEQQAFALSDRLVESGIEKVFSSSSNRAIKTAEPLCRRLGLDCTQLDWMHENHVAEEFKGISTHTWCFFDEKVMDIFHSDETFALGERWYEQAAFADTKYKQGTIRIRDKRTLFCKRSVINTNGIKGGIRFWKRNIKRWLCLRTAALRCPF